MKRHTRSAGFSLVETLVAMAILSVMFAMGMFYWQGRLTQNALRYGTFQVSSDIRQAQEMAKSERYQYTVAFTAGTTSYTVRRIDWSTGGYNKTVQLPSGVTTNTVSVVFDAFGRPGGAYTVTVSNSAGTGSALVNATGGITYTLP